ncbi:MAG: EamA family transporter [Ignavibacteriae bacterium]|nr:EamA family transporter [Ignavibacteriota bacterium]
MDWYTLAFLSAVFSAAAAISQKKILFNIDALEFSFVLSLFNALLALLFLINTNLDSISFLSLLILYGKTILGALAFYFVMLALKNMEISGALPLMVLTPGIVAIFAFFILGESLNSFEIVGLILLLFGTYILEVRKSKNFFQPFQIFVKSKYHHYIIYALLLFTLSSIIDKLLLRDYKLPPYEFIGFQHLFLAVNFLIFVLISKNNPTKILSKVNSKLFGWIFLISIFTIGYRYTQIEAVKIAPVALVLTIKRTSVFFAVVFGGKLFSEQSLMKKTIATIIMLVGAYLIVTH